jgi:hypothetical protein
LRGGVPTREESDALIAFRVHRVAMEATECTEKGTVDDERGTRHRRQLTGAIPATMSFGTASRPSD